eukprot:6205192-Pleurochrysis_carterae.AAC.1
MQHRKPGNSVTLAAVSHADLQHSTILGNLTALLTSYSLLLTTMEGMKGLLKSRLHSTRNPTG